jgi:hypothetical protein
MSSRLPLPLRRRKPDASVRVFKQRRSVSSATRKNPREGNGKTNDKNQKRVIVGYLFIYYLQKQYNIITIISSVNTWLASSRKLRRFP